MRVPGHLNRKVRNSGPCFYSGRSPLQLLPSPRHSAVAVAQFNTMMNDRFTTFYFTQPLPYAERVMAWPQCARCAARFYLQGDEANSAAAPGGAASSSASDVAQGPPEAQHGGIVAALTELARLHSCGALDDQEFKAAKEKLLA